MRRFLALLVWVFASTVLYAEVRLPKVLASHMVLQRNAEVTLWGWADSGEQLTVTGDWTSEPTKVTADAKGNWQVKIKTGDAGGPHKITIVGKNTLTLEDVLFGEVWIGSGQSNMEMPLSKVSGPYSGIQDSAQEVAAARYPQIRLFRVGNLSSKEPLADVDPGVSMYGVPPSDCTWAACTPETVQVFSSVSFFFARELHRELQVPIGMIDASWGGTAAETWTPLEGLQKLGYAAAIKDAQTKPQDPGSKVPTRLYNGMIHPLLPLKLKGVIWYQGESNVDQADKYRELFTTMIQFWRQRFGYAFPFYFVEIAPYNYGKRNAAPLREAQLQTLALEGTGMVSTIDIGNPGNIHPKNKQEVGRRLALWALAKDYGREIVFSGPLYKSHTIEGNKIRIHFNYTGSGLVARDGKALTHFSIAGEDKQFHPATAAIEGDDVIVSSDAVTAPRAVRFAFDNVSVPNLMNKEGLPASGFRTDSW